MTSPTLFRGVDTAVFVAALSGKLRMVGIEVGLSASHRLAQSLAVLPPSDPTSMYWVTRTCLVDDPSQIERFDAVFDLVFAGDGLPLLPKDRDKARPTPNTTGTLIRHSGPTDGLAEAKGRFDADFRPSVGEAEDDNDEVADDAEPTALPEVFPAEVAALADEPFESLSAADLDVVGKWLERAMTDFPTRPSRRHRPAASSGSIDLKRTVAQSRATFAEPVKIMRRTRRLKPRRVVMVGDVSGSMQSFTRIYLHLMRVLVKSNAEVFTFSTSLRRVTVQLRDRDPQAAIDRMSEEVADRFSGTQIAGSLQELLASPVWSCRLRGAVVLIASDGWEAGDPAELQRAMTRLSRFAHRVVWVNPRLAADDFEPATEGMAAALPHVDQFVSGHSLRTMREVVDALS